MNKITEKNIKLLAERTGLPISYTSNDGKHCLTVDRQGESKINKLPLTLKYFDSLIDSINRLLDEIEDRNKNVPKLYLGDYEIIDTCIRAYQSNKVGGDSRYEETRQKIISLRETMEIDGVMSQYE